MLLLLISVGLYVIVIVLASGLTSKLQLDDLSAAFNAALAIAFSGWLITIPLGYVEATLYGDTLGSPLLHAALAFVTNAILFLLATMFVPGIAVRGIGGLVLIGALLTVVDWLMPPTVRLLFSTIPN